MRNKAESKKGQSGQILIYTTIIVMLAALILVPLMQFAFTSHRSAQIREERTLELYASDAGIEDALYQIKTEKKGTDLANLGFGNTSAYNPGTPGMNDRTENVSVEKVWIPEGDVIPSAQQTEAPVDSTTPSLDTDKSSDLVVVGMLKTIQAEAASDYFDSGWPGSGSGNWAGSWGTTGSVTVNSTEGCNGNSLKLADVPSTATRTVNLLKYMKPQLKFSAKASSLEYGDNDKVDLKVKYGDSDWETPVTWGDGNETSSCEAFSIDLYDLYGWAGNDTSVPLQISFDADFSILTEAEDDFRTGDLTGGSGWYSSSWTPSGSSASVVSTGSPHSDSWHVKLSGTGSVKRQVKLASGTTPEITVWAKQSSFGSGDAVTLSVSENGTTWYPITGASWNSSSSSSYTTAYTYPIPSNYAGKTIWIRFLGSMSTSGTTIASDGFESGWTNSGSGWAGVPWVPSPTNSGVTTSGSPRTGSRHLGINRQGYAAREINLSSDAQTQLRYYYKMSSGSGSWEGSDHGYLEIYLNGSLYGTVDLAQRTSYSSSVSTYDLPQGQVKIRFVTNTNNDNEYLYIDDISIVPIPCFYFDDVSVTHAVETEGDSFYVDNLWIGAEYNSNTIEIAYTDATLGDAFLDRVGIWMPPGCHYVAVVGNETSVELRQEPTTILPSTYADGTIVEWDYGNVELHKPLLVMPKVKTLTFTYEVDVAQSVEGMFTWLEAHEGPSKLKTYISWDKGYEIYKAVSQAHSDIYGTNTQVTAYASQGEVNKTNAASYGDYVAAGAALLFDSNNDDIKDKAVNPSDPYTWVTYPSPSGFLYDGRDQITSIPSDAKVTAAWLYWSAFMNTTDWASHGSKADGNVSFMYPKEYGPETFAVSAGHGNDIYTTVAWRSSGNEPMDLLAHQPVLTLSQVKYTGEFLGNATAGHGNDTFWTAHKYIKSPAPIVSVNAIPRSQSGNYMIDYNTGNVTIINDALSGSVTIDYWAAGSMKLTEVTDYTIDHPHDLGSDIRYEGFTVKNDNLEGTVTIDYYYAKHWVAVQHAAYNKYDMLLDPAQTEVDDPDYGYVGNTYACFADVTELLTGNGMYTGVTGDGQYAVGDVTATPGVPNDSSHHYGTRCFSGWSIIVLYESPTGQAHQFYLWDPIHNKADCPFMVQPTTDSTIYPPCIYAPPYVQVPFTLNNFYPPEGTVSGNLTYFVGEGDADTSNYGYDYVGFKGASKPSYTFLSGPNNPQNNVMNCLSTNGDGGTDIDTYPVTDEVGSDTQANVLLRTQGDRWYLVYIILSFKTNEVPKADYAFNVASVTYQYELGAQ